MRRNDEDHQRSRCTPLVLPSFDLEVQSADVDAAASLLDGMTIVPSPSVMSLASTTIPTPTLWSDARALPFTTRSGGAHGDSVSVLTAVTAPPTLQGCAVFGGEIGGGGASLPSLMLSACTTTIRMSAGTVHALVWVDKTR